MPTNLCVIVLTVEVELPSNLSEELQETIVDDLTGEYNLETLRKGIKRWARVISGENCHVAVDVE